MNALDVSLHIRLLMVNVKSHSMAVLMTVDLINVTSVHLV